MAAWKRGTVAGSVVGPGQPTLPYPDSSAQNPGKDTRTRLGSSWNRTVKMKCERLAHAGTRAPTGGSRAYTVVLLLFC